MSLEDSVISSHGTTRGNSVGNSPLRMVKFYIKFMFNKEILL